MTLQRHSIRCVRPNDAPPVTGVTLRAVSEQVKITATYHASRLQQRQPDNVPNVSGSPQTRSACQTLPDHLEHRKRAVNGLYGRSRGISRAVALLRGLLRRSQSRGDLRPRQTLSPRSSNPTRYRVLHHTLKHPKHLNRLNRRRRIGASGRSDEVPLRDLSRPINTHGVKVT